MLVQSSKPGSLLLQNVQDLASVRWAEGWKLVDVHSRRKGWALLELYTLLRTAYLYAHHSSIFFPFLRVCSSLLYRRKKDRSFTFSPVRCSQLILTYTCIGHIRTSKNITNDIVSEYSNQYIGKPSMATRPIHAPQRFYHQGAEKGDDRVSPCRGNRCKRVCPRDTRNLTRAFLSGSSTRSYFP